METIFPREEKADLLFDKILKDPEACERLMQTFYGEIDSDLELVGGYLPPEQFAKALFDAYKNRDLTAFLMAALGSSLVFSQAAMAADTTAKTETSEDADKDATESEDKDVAEDADKADEEKEDLKTIGEKPEEDTEGVFSVKLKNLTGKVITGVTVKNEKDEEYPDNFLKEEDKFEADEERVLWFDPNAKDEEKDAEAKGLKGKELHIYVNAEERAAYYTADGEGSDDYRIDLTTL